MNPVAGNAPVRPPGPGGGDPPNRSAGTALTVLTCAMLVLFGMGQALVGTLFYNVGPVPVASLLFDLGILATCLLGGWGLGRALGAVAPAVGWVVVAFILAAGTGGGSVLITASTAGEWFLYGGAACATAGIIAGVTVWSKVGRARSARL